MGNNLLQQLWAKDTQRLVDPAIKVFDAQIDEFLSFEEGSLRKRIRWQGLGSFMVDSGFSGEMTSRKGLEYDYVDLGCLECKLNCELNFVPATNGTDDFYRLASENKVNGIIKAYDDKAPLLSVEVSVNELIFSELQEFVRQAKATPIFSTGILITAARGSEEGDYLIVSSFEFWNRLSKESIDKSKKI